VKATIHRVIGIPKTGRRGLIFFQGGNGIAGDAISSGINADRYAVQANATVINIEHRMAPETRSP
jgi:acetyl esterase/lipase